MIKGLSKSEWLLFVASLFAKRFKETNHHEDLTCWCNASELEKDY